jgi:sortase A
VEYGLWLIAFVFLGYCAWVWVDARRHQTEGIRELEEQTELKVAPSKGVRVKPTYGSAVAKLEIPRLGLSTVVFEGTGQDVLLRGPGHLRGSALPSDTGNMVIAGHRDTFFRPLQDLRKGDEISVQTPQGTRRYQVASTQIVNPDAIEVLNDTPEPILTLITCYPFRFVGNAPQRFIAKARELKDSELVGRDTKDRAGELPTEPLPMENVAARVSTAPVQPLIRSKAVRPKPKLRPFSTLAVPNPDGPPEPDPGPRAEPPTTPHLPDPPVARIQHWSSAPQPTSSYDRDTRESYAPEAMAGPQATPKPRWSRFLGTVGRIVKRQPKPSNQ